MLQTFSQTFKASSNLVRPRRAQLIAALLWDYKNATSLSTIARIGPTPTFSRGSKAWAFVGGVLTEFAADEPVLTGGGYLHEPQRTNKCQNSNASPTDLTGVTKSGDAAATLTVVDDSTELDAAGLNIGNGNVYKLDNSSGSSQAFARVDVTVGNTNAHSLSIYGRAGSGSPQLRTNFDTGAVSFSNSAYQKIKSENITPGSTSEALQILCAAGEVAYFTLNQLEEGTTATSPIVVAGAAVTRNEPSQTTGVNGTGEPDVSGGCTLVWRSSAVEAAVPAWVIRLEDDASNYPDNYIANGNGGGSGIDRIIVYENGQKIISEIVFTDDDALHTRVLRIGPSGATVWEDGTQVYSDTTDYSTVLANVKGFRVGYNVQGEYEFARLYTSLLSDSECLRLSNLV